MNKYDIIRLGLNCFELLAFIAGLSYWKKIKNSIWKWFVLYLGVVVCFELFGDYLTMVKEQPNQWLFEYYVIPFEFFFFFWLFYRHFSSRINRLIVIWGALLYAAGFVIDVFYLTGMDFIFLSFSYTLGNVILLIFITMFFVRFVRSDAILAYKSNPMFWVGMGLLLFYLGTLPFFGMWNTLRNQHKEFFNIYWMVQMGLNGIMYVFFALSFICGRPK